MALYSRPVAALGIFECELCGLPGKEDNPLTRHHCSGNNEDHTIGNLLVVHRWFCHTVADAITQMFMSKGATATPDTTVRAWKLLMQSDWLFRLLRGE